MKQDYLQIKMLEVAPQVYASGQLYESDLQLMAKQGARSIVNTLPSSADVAQAAEGYGITLVDFPIDPGPIDKDTAQAFAKTCEELKRPLIVCSHSGGHATRIWETAEEM